MFSTKRWIECFRQTSFCTHDDHEFDDNDDDDDDDDDNDSDDDDDEPRPQGKHLDILLLPR